MADTPYTAAGQGRRLAMWRPSNAGPNTCFGAGTILARARNAVRNDPWAGTFIERSVSNGVGVGIQAKPVWGDEGFKAECKALWNQSVATMDADGVLDFYGQQALAWREWREAGEVFVRLRNRRPEDGLPVPLQVQLIEAEQCPRDMTQRASNGNAIRQGIEFDRIGRRVAYWMHPRHPGDDLGINDGSNDPVRIPADQVLHLFRPLRAGMIRGIPDLASVLVELFNFGNLRDAVLERQKIANLFAGWYTTEPGAAGNDPLAETKTGEASDGTPLAGLEPATMQVLPEGMGVKFSEPPGAGTDYAEFIRGGLLAIAARTGMPYEILTGDLRDVSDRALKLILNEFRRLIEMDQWLYMIPQFLRGVREAWFDAAVLAGKLSVPGYGDIRANVVETLWVPQGWPYSHPVQDVTADLKAIRGGLIPRAQVVMSNGDDVEEVDAQIAEDNARADALGLVLDSDPRKTNAAGVAQANDTPNEESQ